jgi:Spy/CpxP family protein refolding chaperone
MKASLLSLFLIGAALTAIPLQTVLADDGTTSEQTPSSGDSTNSAGNGAEGQRFGYFKEALAELNLSDAQKEQIKEVRASATNRRERHREILGVLTPDQKARLRELIQEHRNGAQSGTGTPAVSGN